MKIIRFVLLVMFFNMIFGQPTNQKTNDLYPQATAMEIVNWSQ